MISDLELWTVIIGLGIGSFAIRFAFLGVVGDRQLPAWALRYLRYTAVSILPALVAPLVLWPAATGGVPDIPRLAAAAVAFTTGYVTSNVAAAIVAGAGTLYALLYLI